MITKTQGVPEDTKAITTNIPLTASNVLGGCYQSFEIVTKRLNTGSQPQTITVSGSQNAVECSDYTNV